jgi:transposase
MGEYIGLDVSLKEMAISIRRDGKWVWRGKCASDPEVLARVIRKRAPAVVRIVFETGPLSVWFYHSLTALGLPAICIDARHAKAALDMAPNKTDAKDADGLAQLAEVGFYREVRVKSYDSMLMRTLGASRAQLLKAGIDFCNHIRGVMKTFGLVVPKGAGAVFEANVRERLAANPGLERIVLPMLEAWRGLRREAAELDRQLVAAARTSQACQLLRSIPGIGAVNAVAFVTAVEDPSNFRNARAAGAWLGLTTRRYQSGEVDYDGHISRRGDRHVRSLLYQAAVVTLTRAVADSALRRWGLALRKRIGFKRAAVAVARKLAVVMLAMLRSGEHFRPEPLQASIAAA